MDIDLINSIIKLTTINFCIVFSFFRILNKSCCSKYEKIIITASIICLTFIDIYIKRALSVILSSIIVFMFLGIILANISKLKLGHSIFVTLLSAALTYIITLLSSLLVFFVTNFICKIPYKNPISSLSICFINVLAIIKFFNCKRLKNGFPFIINSTSNDYLDIFVLIISPIIILLYIAIGHVFELSTPLLTSILVIFAIIAFIIIQKTFILYQKQKLQTQALKDYESELAETKQKLQTALEEKEKLIKTNHEFYHRQEALKNKLNTILTTSTSTEAANEYSNILDRINNLSQEYSVKLAVAPKLQSTNIEEIDDMLSYFQNECAKNNIEFIFKLDCNIDKIITEHIDKSDFETLLGDLLRNAIIAINNSSNTYRSIMLVFGLKDSCYQIDVYDSGVEFKIETLLKLGQEKASTYIGNGGTGIGMLTTFETLHKTESSLIITEFEESNSSYTKLLSIRFDNQNNYCINSPRSEIIKKSNIEKRNILIK